MTACGPFRCEGLHAGHAGSWQGRAGKVDYFNFMELLKIIAGFSLNGRAKRAPHGWYICDFSYIYYYYYRTYVGVCVTPFFFSSTCAVRSAKFMHSTHSLRSPHTCPACS